MSREDLSRLLGLSDRRMRDHISFLRMNGIPICNTQDGSGYFIPATKEEVLAQMKQTRSRAMKELAQIRALKELLREIEDGEQYGERKFE